MSDTAKNNAPEATEDKNEELDLPEQDQVAGGAFDAFLQFQSHGPKP